jgi:uncharacterized protein YcfJ
MSSNPVFGAVAAGLLVSAGLLAAAPVMADSDFYGQDDRPGDADTSGYDYDYARVTHVEPRFRQVRISVPRQECYTETHYVTDEYAPAAARPAAGGMILGGLIGAVIGHQIGDRDNRGVGTLAGAVIGGAIGHDVAQRRAEGQYAGGYGEQEARPVDTERCETRYGERTEQRIDGYRVSYRYNGRNYQADLPYDPGERVRVRVTVSPEGY